MSSPHHVQDVVQLNCLFVYQLYYIIWIVNDLEFPTQKKPINLPIVQQEMALKFVPNVIFYYGVHSAT